MLQVKSVTRMFGAKAAADGVSFSVDGPAFIGRPGAGKSTFLRLMNRVTDAASGQIMVTGATCWRCAGRLPANGSRNAR